MSKNKNEYFPFFTGKEKEKWAGHMNANIVALIKIVSCA
jgi:hypothetical protein